MPSLQVRELPDDIYQTLCNEALLEHRSITQQAIAVLARGLRIDENRQRRRSALLAELQTNGVGKVLSDPVVLIREDRER